MARSATDLLNSVLSHLSSEGAVAQLGERGLCKPEVVGSIPISSTKLERIFSLFYNLGS